MSTFIYTEEKKNLRKGTDVAVLVYKVVNNIPKQIGRTMHQTRAWAGASGEAHKIIAKHLKTKKVSMSGMIKKKGVKIYELGSGRNEVRT